MKLSTRCETLFIILFVVISGCKGMQDVDIIHENISETAVEEREKPPATKELPEHIMIANNLWDYIKRENYIKNWHMWPGKTAFYTRKGHNQYHMPLLTTYVNTTAYNTLVNKSGLMPYESVIITENYNLDKTLSFITAMYKREGYNPEVDDWFWVRYKPDGAVTSSGIQGSNITLAGKVAVCINCHKKNINNDCIFTGNVSTKYGY